MSTYPFWLLSFELREDVDPQVVAVLSAVGCGDPADPLDLDRLPRGLWSYLGQPGQLQSDQGETVAGTPVRLARSGAGAVVLTIEFAQHDDEFANGGWLFWLWVLGLARRPEPTQGRLVLGYHGLYRGDSESQLVHLDADGVTEGAQRISFAEIDAALAEADDAFWT